MPDLETIKVKKISHSQLFIDCDHGTAMELSDYFSFFVPGYEKHDYYK